MKKPVSLHIFDNANNLIKTFSTKPNKNKKKLSYRSFEWNPAKFHSLKFSYIFTAKEVKEIEAKAKKFLEFFPNKDVERTYQAN